MWGMDADWDVLADAVTRRRKALGLSQQELADRADRSRSTIQKVERADARGMAHKTLANIESALLWAPGSLESVLHGGAPTLLHGEESTDKSLSAVLAPTDQLLERLPPRIVFKLRESEVYDTDVYDLTQDGGISMVTIVVRTKDDPRGPDDPEKLRREMRAWEQARRRLYGRPLLPWEPGDPEEPQEGV